MKTFLSALLLSLTLSGCAYDIVMIGTLMVMSERERQEGYIRSHPSIALDPLAPRSVPPMEESRKIQEQDCSKPIVDWSANLRCR